MFWGFIFNLFLGLGFAAGTHELSYSLSGDTGDFSHFQNLLLANRFQNIEEFLTLWKQERPDYYTNYVMAYRSRSLQQSSPTHPRIIMFNQNADFVMSFNSHPRHRGVENIEMIRFNHSENKFEFYELGFSNGRAALSSPNPQKCLECHQSSSRRNVDPRPNWEPYNTWLGFYGSLDDHTDLFKQSFKRESFFNPLTDAFLLEEFDNEPQWFQTFWNDIKPHDQRYALLNTVVNPYSRETTINGDLTNRLATLNHRRIARIVKENKPLYDYIKWTLWSYGVCGQEFAVTPEVRDWLASVSPRKPITSLETKTQVVHCMRLEGADCGPPKTITVPPRLLFTDVVHLLIEPFGQDTEDWSMDFKTGGRYAAFERFGVANDPRPPVRAALERLFGDDPDLQSVSCAEVKEKSLSRFSDLDKVKAFYETIRNSSERPAPAAPLIQRCISCHVNEAYGDIPPIPFDNPTQLKVALQESGYKRGTLMDEILYRTGSHAGIAEQMPPRGLPAEAQRQALIQYLESL